MVSERQVSLAVQGLNALFKELYDAADPSPWAALAREIPSGTGTEVHEWFGAVPQMQEWTGELEIKGVYGHTFSILNKDWAAAISVSKNLIEDNRLAQITPKLEDLALRARQWPGGRIRALLAASAGTTLGACYDGKAFFANDHAEGESGAQDNLLAGTGVTEAKITDDLATGQIAMAGWKDDRGELLEGYSIDTVVIPGSGPIYKVFRELAQGKQSDGVGDWTDVVQRVLIDPSLSDTTDWYGFCTTRPIKPFIHQVRAAPTPVSHTTPLIKDIVYSVQARGAFAYGDWRCGVKFVNG